MISNQFFIPKSSTKLAGWSYGPPPPQVKSAATGLIALRVSTVRDGGRGLGPQPAPVCDVRCGCMGVVEPADSSASNSFSSRGPAHGANGGRLTKSAW